MTYAHPKSLVDVAWLARNRTSAGLRIVDASFKMPGVTPTARQDYLREHIDGAVFFDIDDVADHENPLPHMLPSAAEFAAKLGALGLGDAHRIILYDASGILGAARAWWSLRAFGHLDAAILDGGLKAWKAAGLPVVTEIPKPIPARFTARFDPARVRDRAQVLANINSRRDQVLDARAAPRFEGVAAEPWPGRRSGHIPGSLNLDHTRLVDPSTGTLKPAGTLDALYAEAGIDPAKPVVTSCGSGITASVLAFGLHLIGHENVAVYDGSWAEWGLPGPLPIETGPPRS